MKYKAIIFDFAGVIAVEAYWLFLRENVPNLEEKRDFFMDISHQVDSAEITPEQFVTYIAKEASKTPEQVQEAILNGFVLNEGMFDLIQDLKKNYKIGLLSNFIADWLRYLLKKFNLQNSFDEVVISTEHKMIKPDPGMYQLILQKLGVRPEEAVFIDDRESNVKGAKNVGIKGILFKDLQDLKQKLQELHIVI